MVLGILSDSHGQAGRVRRALELFDRLGVGHIIHCGDVGGAGVFEEIVGRPLSFVWGNTDEPDGGLRAFIKSVGIRSPEAVPLRLCFEAKRILVFHGHESEFAGYSPERDPADYVLHGHSHIQRDERRNGTRFINPGALHRARNYSVATLAPARDELIFHSVE